MITRNTTRHACRLLLRAVTMTLCILAYIVLIFSFYASAQQTTITLNDQSTTLRLQRTNGFFVAYDFQILNSGNMAFVANGQQQMVFSPGREITINRMAGSERALTIDGANSSSFNYNEPLYVKSGTTDLNHPGINWNSGITVESPTNPQRVTGFNHGVWIEDQHVAGTGRALWYQGYPFQWSVEANAATWIWTASPYVNGNWARFGLWCESTAECYLDSQAANAGIAPVITIKGPGLNVEAPLKIESAITVQGQRGFTGQCQAGKSPVFKEGLAVGCQ